MKSAWIWTIQWTFLLHFSFGSKAARDKVNQIVHVRKARVWWPMCAIGKSGRVRLNQCFFAIVFILLISYLYFYIFFCFLFLFLFYFFSFYIVANNFYFIYFLSLSFYFFLLFSHSHKKENKWVWPMSVKVKNKNTGNKINKYGLWVP